VISKTVTAFCLLMPTTKASVVLDNTSALVSSGLFDLRNHLLVHLYNERKRATKKSAVNNKELSHTQWTTPSAKSSQRHIHTQNTDK